MRKYHSSTTNHYQMVWRKLDELRLARIDAAVVEYTELFIDIDNVDFNDIDRRIAEAKQGGFPPLPQWRKTYATDWKKKIGNCPECGLPQGTTVSDVPEAKGNFTW